MKALRNGKHMKAPCGSGLIVKRVLKRELEKRRAGHGVVAVRLGLPKPERHVERLGRTHRGERVEEHSPVAARPRLCDDRLGQAPSEPAAARAGPYEKPLHLAGLVVDPA